MIAIIGDDYFENGPIPIALALAGFEACEIKSPEDAAGRLDQHGPHDCMLVLDARSLELEGDSKSWSHLLDDPRVAAVVVACGEASPWARALTQAPHRILLENPFDAAAVAAAAARASACAPHRIHRVSSSVAPDSKYAS
jgi:hypothetical protein